MHERAGLGFRDPILGIDPSSSTIGWCVLRGSEYDSGCAKFRGELPEKMNQYHWWLHDMVEEWRPAIIVLEEPFTPHGNKSFGTAPMVLQQFKGAALVALANVTVPVYWVESATWKKYVLGHGGITTKQKAEGLIVQQLKGLGFQTSQVDEADAVCIALYMRKKFFDRIC